MKVIVTGAAGLIGSEASAHFMRRGDKVWGVDNNQRKEFFGPDGDTTSNRLRLTREYPQFRHVDETITDAVNMISLFKGVRPDVVIHCAAQPSHDLAARMPLVDFSVNAVGTMNLLEAARRWAPEAPFVFMSTNKVYGDAPNEVPMVEKETRWDYCDGGGINESMRIDRSKHSVFGASKVAADVMVQEYGRYFGMPTVCFRGGCLTGPGHAGAELHGFLSYLVKCGVSGRPFHVYGYKAKQVRDQIHATDVVGAFEAFIGNPRPGAVYNLGGGRENSISVIEAIGKVNEMTGRQMEWNYVEEPRVGDHVCYISDMSAFQVDYPEWRLTRSLQHIFEDLIGKAEKDAVNYRRSRNTAEACDTCRSLELPEFCQVVEGAVKREMVCDKWTLRPRPRVGELAEL